MVVNISISIKDVLKIEEIDHIFTLKVGLNFNVFIAQFYQNDNLYEKETKTLKNNKRLLSEPFQF